MGAYVKNLPSTPQMQRYTAAPSAYADPTVTASVPAWWGSSLGGCAGCGFGQAAVPATPLPTDTSWDDVFLGFCAQQGMKSGEGCMKTGDCGLHPDGVTLWCKTPNGVFEGKQGQPIAQLGAQTIPTGWLMVGAAAVLYFLLK